MFWALSEPSNFNQVLILIFGSWLPFPSCVNDLIDDMLFVALYHDGWWFGRCSPFNCVFFVVVQETPMEHVVYLPLQWKLKAVREWTHDLGYFEWAVL